MNFCELLNMCRIITHIKKIHNLTMRHEFNDKELALTYYNYRHYNSESERWIGRDLLSEKIGKSLYVFASNATTHMVDVCGLAKFPQRPPAYFPDSS